MLKKFLVFFNVQVVKNFFDGLLVEDSMGMWLNIMSFWIYVCSLR